jgi:hypothetical protein
MRVSKQSFNGSASHPRSQLWSSTLINFLALLRLIIVGRGYEVFLKYNSAALLKIASGHNANAREWLRIFLKDCDDVLQKARLLARLDRNP